MTVRHNCHAKQQVQEVLVQHTHVRGFNYFSFDILKEFEWYYQITCGQFQF